jgi:predicted aconitase/predicted aconitase with swiveling domain
MQETYEILYSKIPLSFWGGIDPESGIVIDQTHPLQGKCVTNKILCMPRGRGSCTGSQVMLEMILNGTSPRSIILQEVDSIIVTGVIIAEEFFTKKEYAYLPSIYAVGNTVFKSLEGKKELRISVNDMEIDSEYLVCNDNDQQIFVQDLVKIKPLHQDTQIKSMKKQSRAYKLCLRTISRVGAIQNALKLISVSSAHIDGVTLIGQGGLRFAKRLVELGGKVSIPTTLNSGSIDRRRWKELGMGLKFATDAEDLGNAYLQLGCEMSFTCAPYLLPTRPKLGEDIMWGESNAVVFANSVIGAKTEKYPDYFDICAAIVGMVPYVGVHIEENRLPTVTIDASELISSCDVNADDIDLLFPTLGWICGIHSDGEVPIVIGLEKLKFDETSLKAFCASYGTTGTAPVCHIAGITPETLDCDSLQKMFKSSKRVVYLNKNDIYEALDVLDNKLDSGAPDKVNLVSLGNPHLSINELQTLVELIGNENGRRDSSVRLIGILSRYVHDEGRKVGHIGKLEKFGMEFINDTCWCMLLDPPIIPHDKSGVILTNSGKYAHYGPGLTNRRFRYGSLNMCIEAAKTGRIPNHREPTWLSRSTARTLFNSAKRLF